MRQFFRNWRLQIIPYTKDANGNHKHSKPIPVRDLKMTFNVLDTALGDPLTASLQVFNLSPEVKKTLNTGLCSVVIEVAYGPNDANLLPIFQGDITNSYELRVGPNLIQHIFARDAGNIITNFKPELNSIKTQTPVYVILNKILSKTPNMNIVPDYIGTSANVITNATAVDEWVFGGTFKTEVDNLLKHLGLIWYISGGVLKVINKKDGSKRGTGDSIPFHVSSTTGLLSRPKVDWVGIEFEHLMNPSFKPGNLITIDPETVQRDFGNELYVPQPGELVKLEGQFRVMQAQHKGDTRGSEWKTVVKAFHKVG